MTSDIEAARKFYSGLFGWKYKVSPEYTEIEIGGRSTSGMMPIRPEMNFAVEDTDGTAKKVQSGGRMPGGSPCSRIRRERDSRSSS